LMAEAGLIYEQPVRHDYRLLQPPTLWSAKPYENNSEVI
jgi:hypothetical protein